MRDQPKSKMEAWKTLSREVVLDRAPWLVVESHEVELPDGQLIFRWPWVVAPDYVTIAAMTDESTFLCLRQTKYAVEGITLAAPGGYLESGEIPLAAAKRELLEETGYEASDWTDLGNYVVEANRGVGRGHFFLARHAHRIAQAEADDLEDQELLLLKRDQIEEALIRGEFKVMSWVGTFALALLRLG